MLLISSNIGVLKSDRPYWVAAKKPRPETSSRF